MRHVVPAGAMPRAERRLVWERLTKAGLRPSERMWGLFGCYYALTNGRKKEVRTWLLTYVIPKLQQARD